MIVHDLPDVPREIVFLSGVRLVRKPLQFELNLRGNRHRERGLTVCSSALACCLFHSGKCKTLFQKRNFVLTVCKTLSYGVGIGGYGTKTHHDP